MSEQSARSLKVNNSLVRPPAGHVCGMCRRSFGPYTMKTPLEKFKEDLLAILKNFFPEIWLRAQKHPEKRKKKNIFYEEEDDP